MTLTYGPHLDIPLAEALIWPVKFIDEFAWERDLPEGNAFGQRSWRKVTKEAVGVVGAIVPWNVPFEVSLNKLGQGLATGNTVILKAAANTPWNATRIGRLVAEQTTSLPASSRSSPPRTTRWPKTWSSIPGSISFRSPVRPRSAGASWRRVRPP